MNNLQRYGLTLFLVLISSALLFIAFDVEPYEWMIPFSFLVMIIAGFCLTRGDEHENDA